MRTTDSRRVNRKSWKVKGTNLFLLCELINYRRSFGSLCTEKRNEHFVAAEKTVRRRAESFTAPPLNYTHRGEHVACNNRCNNALPRGQAIINCSLVATMAIGRAGDASRWRIISPKKIPRTRRAVGWVGSYRGRVTRTGTVLWNSLVPSLN